MLLNRHQKYGDLACASYYAAVVLEALAHLHERRYVYRDVKPENVVVRNDGVAKLCDLGLARVQDAAAAEQRRPPGARLPD